MSKRWLEMTEDERAERIRQNDIDSATHNLIEFKCNGGAPSPFDAEQMIELLGVEKVLAAVVIVIAKMRDGRNG